MAQARAGMGDTFPVQERDGRTLFRICVVEGNDDRLVLEIRTTEAPRRVELRRDKPVSVQIAESRYELLYPSVTVSSGGPPTTTKATLIVTRRP